MRAYAYLSFAPKLYMYNHVINMKPPLKIINENEYRRNKRNGERKRLHYISFSFVSRLHLFRCVNFDVNAFRYDWSFIVCSLFSILNSNHSFAGWVCIVSFFWPYTSLLLVWLFFSHSIDKFHRLFQSHHHFIVQPLNRRLLK